MIKIIKKYLSAYKFGLRLMDNNHYIETNEKAKNEINKNHRELK